MTNRKTKHSKVDDLLDAFMTDARTPEEMMAGFQALRKRALERVLSAEMDEHLGYEKHATEGHNSGNSRNGYGKKRLITEDGEVELQVPRDRQGTFEPKVVQKGQRRLSGFDDKLIALYARGMSTRDIQAHVQELYDVDIEPSLVSRVTEKLLDDAKAWQQRQLDAVYPIVYFDALVVKVRQNGRVQNLAVYVVFAVDMQGMKQVLGLWFAPTEGAKFWLQVLTELRNRGVEDILFACVDGLKGFPEAFEATFPRAVVQTCIVHQVRHSVRLVAWKNRRAVVAKLKPIYQAATEEAALAALEDFEEAWGTQYPTIGRSWRANWAHLSPFFGFAPEIRKAIYTTNPVEALNRQLRKVLKTRGALPSEEAVFKLLWLNIDRTSRKWTLPRHHWDQVVQQLAIHFGDRVPVGAYTNR